MKDRVVVEISIEDPRWDEMDFASIAQSACDAGAKASSVGVPCEVSILAANDANRSRNWRYCAEL